MGGGAREWDGIDKRTWRIEDGIDFLREYVFGGDTKNHSADLRKLPNFYFPYSPKLFQFVT
jgi:hypothetical protein